MDTQEHRDDESCQLGQSTDKPHQRYEEIDKCRNCEGYKEGHTSVEGLCGLPGYEGIFVAPRQPHEPRNHGSDDGAKMSKAGKGRVRAIK